MKAYYQHAGIAIYHGDCREVLPTLDAGSVDLVLTDPPYGTEDLGGGYGRRQLWNIGDGKGRVIVGDTDLSAIRDVWPWARTLVKDGWGMVFFGARKTPELCEVFGSEWFGEIIWDKGAPGLGYHIRYAHESVAVLRLGNPPRPDDPLSSVIRLTSSSELHPHQKPVSLLARLMEWGSPLGGFVLDPFLGSGTTLVAAKMLGRQGIGIEISEAYCEIAAKRLQQEVLPMVAEREIQAALI